MNTMFVYMDPVNPLFTFYCFKTAAYILLQYFRKDLTVAPLERVHQSTRAAPFYEGMSVSKQRDCLSLCQAMQHIWIHLNAVLTRLLAISVVSSGQVVNTFTFTTLDSYSAVRTRLRPGNKTRPSFYIWSRVVAKQELNKSELKSLPAGVMGTKLSQSSPLSPVTHIWRHKQHALLAVMLYIYDTLNGIIRKLNRNAIAMCNYKWLIIITIFSETLLGMLLALVSPPLCLVLRHDRGPQGPTKSPSIKKSLVFTIWWYWDIWGAPKLPQVKKSPPSMSLQYPHPEGP